MSYHAYRELHVWQEAMSLVEGVYHLSSFLPASERFGLSNQMCRAAVSIPSNIAEGYRQSTTVHQIRFINIAYGSAAELETQIDLVKRLHFCTDENALSELMVRIDTVSRLLNGYISYLKKRTHGLKVQRNDATT